MAVNSPQGPPLTALGSPQMGQLAAVKLLHPDAGLAQPAWVEAKQQKSSAPAACLHPAQDKQHSLKLVFDQSPSLLDQVV